MCRRALPGPRFPQPPLRRPRGRGIRFLRRTRLSRAHVHRRFQRLGKAGLSKNNIAVRGLIIKLPHDLYVCFDQDLLRVAGIWHGEPGGKFLTFTTIPAISYNIPNKKSDSSQKDLPKPIGKPLMATGLMPGWSLKAAKDVTPPDLVDPRGLLKIGDRITISFVVEFDCSEPKEMVKKVAETNVRTAGSLCFGFLKGKDKTHNCELPEVPRLRCPSR